jgi:hypothetical protein
MARKNCTLFWLFLVEKEERQNSNCGVIFSQKLSKEWARFCQKAKEMYNRLFFV